MNGARQVECTINGLGERAGNASLEEVVMAVRTRHDVFNCQTGIDTREILTCSKLVSSITGFPVQPNKAIVGENAFTHESGIHTQGLLVNPLTYEPIDPELVGRTRRISSGKHSGMHGIKDAVEKMGLNPTEEQLKEIFLRVKTLGDKGKTVMDADMLAITETVLGLCNNRAIKLEELTVVCGNKVTPTASVKLTLNEKEVCGAAFGVGPDDAAINALKTAILEAEPIQLEQYHVKSITGGTDAMVEVEVRMRKGNRTATAMGIREDIVMASIESVISCINVLTTNYNNKNQQH
jgi:D-citramalate synthase